MQLERKNQAKQVQGIPTSNPAEMIVASRIHQGIALGYITAGWQVSQSTSKPEMPD
jgi:hypothetical protein